MTNTERNAVALCCGLLEGIQERNTGLYAENIRIGIGVLKDLIKKEPTTSVWHGTKEKPKEGCKIAFWDGYRMMGMDYADCRHLNNWLSHSEKWAYVDDLLKL